MKTKVLPLVIFCLQGLLYLAGWFEPALAAPPAPLIFTLTQPNGVTLFQARSWGNEQVSGLETTAGYTIIQHTGSGYWRYAAVNPATGRLTATDRVVGLDSPPVSALGARPTIINVQEQIAIQGPVKAAAVPTLVVLVQYNNQPAKTLEADWVTTFFGATNSVNHYYREVSYNQFSLTPALETCGAANNGVTHWLTLGTTHPNAGGPSIALAALRAADSCVNFALFDKNGDTKITTNELLPIIIVAGYENSYGGNLALTPNVWGHQSSFNFKSADNGVTVLNYAQFGEWHATSWDYPGHQATIGLMVHEMGHLLGWPDLYDNLPPGNPDSEGVGEWSVMGHGLWLGTTFMGDTPAHPSAWEKWYQGWLTPLQLRGNHLNYSIPAVEINPHNAVIQLLDNPAQVDWSFGDRSGRGEYFLVENRRQIGYDARLPGCGLLIWHIDESVVFSNWANSNEDHKLVDLEEADGLQHLDNQINRGDNGDPYPGAQQNTVFSNLSMPGSQLYSGSASGVSISNISAGCANTITAGIAAPPALQLTTFTSANPMLIGQPVSFTLQIINSSIFTAAGIVITSTMPPATTLNVASLSGDASISGDYPYEITWHPAVNLAPQAVLTRSFTVVVNPGVADNTTLTNTTYLASNLGANTLTTTTVVAAPGFAAFVTPSPLIIETTTLLITYTIFLENNGHAAGTGVLVSNTIPQSTTYVTGSASHAGAETFSGSGAIAWPAVTITAGSKITRTFHLAVTAPLVDGVTLVNHLTVNSAEGITVQNRPFSTLVGGTRNYLPIITK